MAAISLLPGYSRTISDAQLQRRYSKKLKLIGGKDPYEIPIQDWKDDIDLWPSTTCIHVGMYLVFSPSPYTGDDLQNYKSLECHQRFVDGWVRDIFKISLTHPSTNSQGIIHVSI